MYRIGDRTLKSLKPATHSAALLTMYRGRDVIERSTRWSQHIENPITRGQRINACPINLSYAFKKFLDISFLQSKTRDMSAAERHSPTSCMKLPLILQE